MTDQIPDDTPEGRPEDGTAIIPEVVEDPIEPVLSADDNVLITTTIAFINRTVSAKALETGLLIGDYILTNYFNDDIEAAFSKDPVKPFSFNMLCQQPDLRISRNKLVDMVKVAAQERFFRAIEINLSSLNYTHRLKLTRLPNDESKIDMAHECIRNNLNTRQLSYRVRMKTIENLENEPVEGDMPEPDPAEQAVNHLIAALNQLTGQVASLRFETIFESIGHLSLETKGFLQSQLMTFVDTMSAAEIKCEELFRELQPQASEH